MCNFLFIFVDFILFRQRVLLTTYILIDEDSSSLEIEKKHLLDVSLYR